MATINLGAIKFNWKGAYNSSTSYAVDDVVSSGGNSYVCIQAHSNQAVGNATAYWNIMATKGTDADLLNIASTAQGDIYYNNGSAIARLAAGTSGQLLKSGGSGANPSWHTQQGGGVLQTVFTQTSTEFTSSSDTYVATPITGTITPTSASSKIVLFMRALYGVNGDSYPRYKWYRSISGGASGFINTEPTNDNGGNSLGAYLAARAHTSNEDQLNPMSDVYQDSPNTTSAITYTLYGVRENGGYFHINTTDNNAEGQQNPYNQTGNSNLLLMETGV